MMSQTRRARMVWSPARVALADAAREHAGECHDGLLWIHAGGGRKQRAIGNGEAGDGVDLAVQGAATSRRVSAHPAGAVHVRCEEPELVGLVTLPFHEVEAPLRAHAAAGGVEGQSLCGSGSEVETRGCLQSGYGVPPILGAKFVADVCAALSVGRDRTVGEVLVRAVADAGDQYSRVRELDHRLPVRLPEAGYRYRKEVRVQRWTLYPEPVPRLVVPQKLVADGRQRDSSPGVDLFVVAP